MLVLILFSSCENSGSRELRETIEKEVEDYKNN
jgi:hypothetical protein